MPIRKDDEVTIVRGGEHKNRDGKVIQVYEMSLVRHSMMLVGPSGVGKSAIVSVLHAALENAPASETQPPMVGQSHRISQINPKAITAPQMFGSLDVVANEWTEGIFASLWRKANKDKKHFTWVILDGPVDAIWIENMNTVMDDNRILTLANNDRIPMLRPNVTLHFEVEDLRNASPATVSRAGIIYISEADLGYQPMVTSWFATRTKDGELIKKHYDKYVGATIAFMRKECKPKMAIADMSLLTTMNTLMDSMLKDLVDSPSDEGIERFVIYALIWRCAVRISTPRLVGCGTAFLPRGASLTRLRSPLCGQSRRRARGSGPCEDRQNAAHAHFKLARSRAPRHGLRIPRR